MKFIISVTILAISSLSLTAQNVGIGTTTPLAKLHVDGDTNSTAVGLTSQINYSGLVDIPAIQGISVPAGGWGYGASLKGGYMGLFAQADGGAYAGTSYGVFGQSYGTDGTRIGIYGIASGGSVNWAGYFDGRSKFTDHVEFDKSLYAADYIQTNRNLIVRDTAYSSTIHTRLGQSKMRIKAATDILLTIDKDNGGYASALFVQDGLGNNVFAADEHGNARTYGEHYIDSKLGVGTQLPTQQLDVDYGNLIVQGMNSFQTGGDAGIIYLGGIHHYIKGEYGFGVKLGVYAVGDALVIKEVTGNVGIGTTTPANGYKLSVNGKIMGEELKIQNSATWPDYVFHDDYELMQLDDLQKSINENGHLPGIPSAEDVEQNGIMVGDMQKRTMEKIEELTLYILQLHKDVSALRERNESLERRVKELIIDN